MSKKVTAHASLRVRKRAGLPKKAVQKNADTALLKGVSHKESKGRLRKYFNYLFLSHMKGSDIRMYGGYVYIFTSSNLVTVFQIPNIYRDAVNKILKRKDEELIPDAGQVEK